MYYFLLPGLVNQEKKKFLQTEFSSVRYFLMKFCEHVLFLFCKDEKRKKGGPFSLDLTEL